MSELIKREMEEMAEKLEKARNVQYIRKIGTGKNAKYIYKESDKKEPKSDFQMNFTSNESMLKDAESVASELKLNDAEKKEFNWLLASHRVGEQDTIKNPKAKEAYNKYHDKIREDYEKIGDKPKIEKSLNEEEEEPMTLEQTILELGPEGIKKALPLLSEEQKALLGDVLKEMKLQKSESEKEIDAKEDKAKKKLTEAVDDVAEAEAKEEVKDHEKEMHSKEKDMKKSHDEPLKNPKYTAEPMINTTPNGDYLENEESAMFTDIDEDVADVIESKNQAEVRHQGGVPVEGWQGENVADPGSSPDLEAQVKAEEEKRKEKQKIPELMKGAEMKKSGEGSRGGKVIGHTKSGKPIYENAKHDSHKGFTKEDHRDAVKLNSEKAIDSKDSALADRHQEAAYIHGLLQTGAEAHPTRLGEVASAFKKSLKSMIFRMQERKLEKSKCISTLAKNLEVAPEKIEKIWDLIKAEGDLKEANQVKPPVDAKASESQADVVVPAYEDKSAKKKDEKVPMSGASKQTADEGEQPPKPLAKSESFWHEDELVYEAKEDVFKSNTFGKRNSFSVDAFIEECENAKKNVLAKSTFLWEDEETEEVLEKARNVKYIRKIGTGKDAKYIYKEAQEKRASEQKSQVSEQADNKTKQEKSEHVKAAKEHYDKDEWEKGDARLKQAGFDVDAYDKKKEELSDKRYELEKKSKDAHSRFVDGLKYDQYSKHAGFKKYAEYSAPKSSGHQERLDAFKNAHKEYLKAKIDEDAHSNKHPIWAGEQDKAIKESKEALAAWDDPNYAKKQKEIKERSKKELEQKKTEMHQHVISGLRNKPGSPEQIAHHEKTKKLSDEIRNAYEKIKSEVHAKYDAKQKEVSKKPKEK